MLTKHNPWGEPFGDVVALPAEARVTSGNRVAEGGGAKAARHGSHAHNRPQSHLGRETL
jgi:hypothetical protein